ncbi:MAG: 3-isopropylmalate dehydratase large subunit [Candidatus Binatia bacterium]
MLDKVWDAHTVAELPSGQTQLFIGLHLVHEVTSPQAFQMLRELGLPVLFPDRTIATVDHIIPTHTMARPFDDEQAETMMSEIEKNCRQFGITLYDRASGHQGIVHVIGPEMGLTQPGMTIACGDSHTSTHGAFGSIAFGIGTSQVRDVLASQCLAIEKPKLRRVEVNGALPAGVYAKDVILHIIRTLGVKGGVGYAYEFAGSTFDGMTMEERMTVCNMSIEGGARCGYVNPDQTTFDYLRGRALVPSGAAFDRAVAWWKGVASEPAASYDAVTKLDGSSLTPVVTWGINPGQAIGVGERIPDVKAFAEDERDVVQDAYAYMDWRPGAPLAGTKIDVAFIGSCTNGRISDLREAARAATLGKVKSHVQAIVVPGSPDVARQAEAEGLPEVFRAAGFEWRLPGCSMCLAMNPDKLSGRQVCASSSNRNFKGRQGSPSGRTLLMSPAMVAAAAIEGAVTDVRDLLGRA